MGSLVPRHPYALGSLFPFGFRHDAKFGSEEVVEEGGFTRRLGPEDGYEVVVEASLPDLVRSEVAREGMT